MYSRAVRQWNLLTCNIHMHNGFSAQFCTVSCSITLYVFWLRRSCIPLTRPWVKTDLCSSRIHQFPHSENWRNQTTTIATRATRKIATTLQSKAGFAGHDFIWSVIQHCKNVAACCCICQTELSQLSQYEAPRAGELCAALLYPSSFSLDDQTLPGFRKKPASLKQAAVHDTHLAHLGATWGFVLMWRLSLFKGKMEWILE